MATPASMHHAGNRLATDAKGAVEIVSARFAQGAEGAELPPRCGVVLLAAIPDDSAMG